MNSRLDVAIVTGRLAFPVGGAAASRIGLIGRGLVDAGARATVLLSGPAPVRGEQFERRGAYRGLSFQFASGPVTSRGPRVWQRMAGGVQLRIGFLAVAVELLRRRRRNELDVVLIYSRSVPLLAFMRLVTLALGVPLVLDCCEWPSSQVPKGGRLSLTGALYCRFCFDCADAVLPISEPIETSVRDYVRRRGRPVSSCRLPILVDVDEFQVDGGLPGNYVLFAANAGYLLLVQRVLRAFGDVRHRHPGLKLLLVGPMERELVAGMVASMALGDSVEQTGYVSRTDLLKLYTGAAALLLPLPDDLVSKTRFPTKLGEYLASGRPVVATSVGELARYLVDGVNALTTAGGDMGHFAEKVHEALADPEQSLRIGRAGRRTAEECFDYRLQGAALLRFLHTLRVPGLEQTRTV